VCIYIYVCILGIILIHELEIPFSTRSKWNDISGLERCSILLNHSGRNHADRHVIVTRKTHWHQMKIPYEGHIYCKPSLELFGDLSLTK
jgi:hypothetical protein